MTNTWIIRNPAAWDSLFEFLRKLDLDKPLEVSWGPRKRTRPQNRYYWEVVTPAIALHLTDRHQFPYTKEMAHDLMKSQFLPQTTDPVTGRIFYGSTTKLRRSGEYDEDGPVTHWQHYIMKIQHWAALSGLQIPEPNEEAAWVTTNGKQHHPLMTNQTLLR